jgi:hypothetical protein
MSAPKKRVALYVRVSSEEQVEGFNAWCELNWNVSKP